VTARIELVGVVLASILATLILAFWLGVARPQGCHHYGDLLQGHDRYFECIEHQK
jgi:hypothetical protein